MAQLNTRPYRTVRSGGAHKQISMYYVYVIYSCNFDRYYVGMTDALNRRLEEHNNGKNQSTKAYKPWELVYKESLDSREAARKREKYLKSAAGRRWRKNFIRPRGATE